MVGVDGHPSLAKLSWSVPQEMQCRQFSEALLYCCRTSIQDLKVDYILHDYEWEGLTLLKTRYREATTWKPGPPNVQTLSTRPSFDQIGPFALKKIRINSRSDEAFVNRSALHRCYLNITDAGVHIMPGNIVEVPPTFSSIRILTGLDLTNGYHGMNIFAILSYFSQLQRISLPHISNYETLSQILDKLYQTGGQSFQAFRCTHVFSGTILWAQQSFPSLKGLHVSQSVVNLTWLSPKWACRESLEVLVIDGVLCPEWALPSANTWGHNDVSSLPNCKENSKRAKEYLADVSRLHTRLSEPPRLRTIALKCEDVFRPFFTPEQAIEYINTYSSDANSRRSMTLEDLS